MKEALCKEFCSQLQVHKVPEGLAVGTNFTGLSGDPIGFYVVGPDSQGLFKIEDNGTTIPILESAGCDLSTGARRAAFNDLLNHYEVSYDEESGELKSEPLPESLIPKAALRFVAMMLRIQDFLLLTRERVENTFREDAMNHLRITIGESATITENDIVNEELGDFRADAVIRAPHSVPIALYLVMNDAKLYEAMLLQSEAEHKVHVPIKVIALLERQDSVMKKTFTQALNRLTPLQYRGEEGPAMARIKRELSTPAVMH
jgi:hypothetical protein